MNIPRFIERRNKGYETLNNTYAGGSSCIICLKYCMDGSYVCGMGSDGNTHESHTPPSFKMTNGICEYCIDDLGIDAKSIVGSEEYLRIKE